MTVKGMPACSSPDEEEVILSEAEIEALRAAAEAGDAVAQFEWAELLAEGEAVPQEDAEAVRWFRAAGATWPRLVIRPWAAGATTKPQPQTPW